MVIIVGKCRLDNSVPAFRIVFLTTVAAHDKVICSTRHGHIKQPSIFVLGGRFQSLVVGANEMIGEPAARQPDRKGVGVSFNETQFRDMAMVEGLRSAINDEDHRRLKAF